MKRALSSVLCASLLSLGGCTADWAKQNNSAILFEIGQIRAVSNSTTDGASANILYSDVSQVINDDLEIDVNIFQKNPLISASSPNNHVYLDSYRIRFFRTDGRNVEGVDVPHSITGPLSARIHTPSSGTEQELSVIVTAVRQQAKLEPPLRNLLGTPVSLPGGFNGGGAIVLTTVAEVTLFARTLTGSNVTATGRIQVTFADFVD
jgi:hypothetical protein